MKHKYELYGAAACVVLLFALVYIIGARAGFHDNKILEEQIAKMKNQQTAYEAEIASLQQQLEMEREIEHIIVEETYVPMPVEYETASEIDATAITMLAQMAWGEDRGIDVRPNEVAAVIETALNRVDDPRFPNTILEVITQEGQYHGYISSNPVDYRYYNLALDCYLRWKLKALGVSDPGYVIPYNCVNFSGRNGANHFSIDGIEVVVEKGDYN